MNKCTQIKSTQMLQLKLMLFLLLVIWILKHSICLIMALFQGFHRVLGVIMLLCQLFCSSGIIMLTFLFLHRGILGGGGDGRGSSSCRGGSWPRSGEIMILMNRWWVMTGFTLLLSNLKCWWQHTARNHKGSKIIMAFLCQNQLFFIKQEIDEKGVSEQITTI